MRPGRDYAAYRAQREADAAQLVDHFGWLSFDALAGLTAYQKERILRHARTKSGAIRLPGSPEEAAGGTAAAPSQTQGHGDAVQACDDGTLEGDLRDLRALATAIGLTPESVAATEAQIRAKHAAGGQ